MLSMVNSSRGGGNNTTSIAVQPIGTNPTDSATLGVTNNLSLGGAQTKTPTNLMPS